MTPDLLCARLRHRETMVPPLMALKLRPYPSIRLAETGEPHENHRKTIKNLTMDGLLIHDPITSIPGITPPNDRCINSLTSSSSRDPSVNEQMSPSAKLSNTLWLTVVQFPHFCPEKLAMPHTECVLPITIEVQPGASKRAFYIATYLSFWAALSKTQVSSFVRASLVSRDPHLISLSSEPAVLTNHLW